MQLYINTYGTYVHVKDEMFEIRVKKDGTYSKHLYSSKKVKTLVISQGAAISSDAVKLAIVNNIDILFIERNGYPLGRVWHSKLGSTSKIRKAQLKASLNKTGLNWVKSWIAQKLQNQTDFLKELKKHRQNYTELISDTASKIAEYSSSVRQLEGNAVTDIEDQLRGIEGTAGRIYFQCLSNLLYKPYQFEGRSFRPAKDPFNAFLNYAYGILYGKIEKALIIAGLDPYVGFMHRDDYNQTSFVYDFIEPYRIIAEKTVFKLFSAKKVKNDCTDTITNGISLNKNGKALLIEAFNKQFLETKIRYKGRNVTREAIMQTEAHRLANTLISKPDDNIDLKNI